MKKLSPILCLGLCACEALSPNRPIIENRYRTLSPAVVQQDTSVSLAVTTAPVPDDSNDVALTALSDRAQAALIEQTKGKPPIKLSAAEKSTPAAQLRSSLKRRVIVSVMPSNFLPAGDRIDAIDLAVSLTTVPWRFSSWSQASNGEVVIEVGKLTGVTTSKLGASTGLKIAKILPDLSIEAARETSDTRELSIRDVTQFDAAVRPDGQAWLVETAGWRQNLAHNFSIDVVAQTPAIELDPAPAITIGPLYTDDGETNPPSKLRIKQVAVYNPRGSLDPVCGKATLRYRIRHVARGGNTFTESDDDIEHRIGTSEASFLFSPPPFTPTYGLKFGERSLSYKYPAGQEVVARFESLADATALRDWLIKGGYAGGRLRHW